MKPFWNLLVIASLAGLAGCASGPVTPDWQLNTRDAMANFVTAYLGGNAHQAELEFAHARSEIASSGRLDLLARAMLVRCAARVASLDLAPCTDFDALAQDARPEERAYAAFLAGHWDGLSAMDLPQQYRSLLAAKGEPAQLKEIKEIKDPLSRLVAGGVLLQSGKLTPEGIALAVDAASEQGWRRPLLAWLGVQAQRADAVGDAALAAQVRRRSALAGAR
jgi:hypothetical protein